jgi:hypothetical protein
MKMKKRKEDPPCEKEQAFGGKASPQALMMGDGSWMDG